MDKKFSKQLDNDVSDGGHKTHTTALVLMVLFTGLVLTIALGDSSSLGQVQDQPNSSNDAANLSQPVAAADLAFVSGIPVDADAVVENQMITRGGEEALEQVITYETQRSTAELTAEYRNWLGQNGYTIPKEKIGNYAASLAATNGDNALIVMISYLTAEDMSRVEIINYRR